MLKLLEIYKEQIIKAVLFLLLSLNFVLWSAVIKKTNASEIEIRFLEGQRTNSEFISAKDGIRILIDGGLGSKLLPLLAGAMPYYDNSIDAVVLTSPRREHVTGLIDVLKRYDVGVVIESDFGSGITEYKEFENIITDKHIKKVVIGRPSSLKFFNSAELILTPAKSGLNAVLNYEGRKISFSLPVSVDGKILRMEAGGTTVIEINNSRLSAKGEK